MHRLHSCIIHILHQTGNPSQLHNITSYQEIYTKLYFQPSFAKQELSGKTKEVQTHNRTLKYHHNTLSQTYFSPTTLQDIITQNNKTLPDSESKSITQLCFLSRNLYKVILSKQELSGKTKGTNSHQNTQIPSQHFIPNLLQPNNLVRYHNPKQ